MPTDTRRDPLIALRIPPDLDARLRAEAHATGSTLSEIVRVALEARLHPAPAKPAPRTPRAKQTTADACGHRVRPGAWCRRCARIV